MKQLSKALSLAVAIGVTACATAKRPEQPTPREPGSTIWEAPDDFASQDLLWGPWGRESAPDPKATYTLVERKHSGVNPGMTVVDERGREWSVKQPYPSDLDNEGPVEVSLSRLLSAVGYHQPPVYHMGSFLL